MENVHTIVSLASTDALSNKTLEAQHLLRYQNNHWQSVINHLTTIIGAAEAQEVYQEALLKVYLLAVNNPSPQSLYEKLETLTPLLFRVSKNMAISRLRHNQVRQRFMQSQMNSSSDTSDISIEKLVIEAADKQLLQEAIRQLPPICKKVFVERKVHGSSHAQIAHQLNISKKTVENHIANGLRLCRQFMLKKYSGRTAEKKKA